MGWRRRDTDGYWPGRGPFRYLPPWERPGWLYGPGSCRWLFSRGFAPSYMLPRSPSVNEQIDVLETYKKDIESELEEITQEIERLKKMGPTKIETEK